MAYDEELAARVRALLAGETELTERKMFGGLGFSIGGNIAVAADGEGDLVVRAEPDAATTWVDGEVVRPMEMRGRSIKGWLLVGPAATRGDEDLAEWVARGVARARSLPAK